MAMFGKSIRIYLMDGTVTGIKLAEVVNHTILSISCPRPRAAELNDIIQSKRPGIYFLFGQDEETNEPKAYIGEAENVYGRLQSHVSTKDFWNEVVLFVSKDENLTKSHVKYLESRLIQIAQSTKRYKIDNYNDSQPSALPAADRDAMEEFLTYIKLLIGVLGHKLLEEVSTNAKKRDESVSINIPPSDNQSDAPKVPLDLSLYISGLSAKALETNEGVVVLAGSEAAKEFSNSLAYGYRELRAKLITNGVLKLTGEKYVFQRDTLFDTATPAAAIIVGYNISGPQSWKDKSGRSLKEIEKQRLHPSE
jgi:Domain of unknown function (DUF4357)